MHIPKEGSIDASRGVLIIASDFPPMAGTNTQRIQSFAKYLGGSGWAPHIITHSVRDLYLIDSSELADIPEHVTVHRVDSADPFRRLRRWRGIGPRDLFLSAQSVAGTSAEATTSSASGEAVTASRGKAGGEVVGRIKRLVSSVTLRPLSHVFRQYVYIPDAERLWATAVVPYANKLIGGADIDVIMSSSPAYSTHVAALKLKRMTGLPWIAEFRDLWVGRPGREEGGAWRRSVDERFEADVVAECDHIIVASPAWIDNFVARYGEAVRAKITCITNGFDSAKIPDVPDDSRADGVLIVNTGAMYGSESPAPFLMALAEIQQETPEYLRKVSVRLAGSAGEEKIRLTEIVESGGLSKIVSFLGILPHRNCLLEQQKADILLLCNGQAHAETIRGRSFEYMSTGKPILALTPRHGEQAKLLERAGTSVLVDHGDIAETKAAILRIIASVREGTVDDFSPNWQYIRQFDRVNLTRRFIDVLDGVAQR